MIRKQRDKVEYNFSGQVTIIPDVKMPIHLKSTSLKALRRSEELNMSDNPSRVIAF